MLNIMVPILGGLLVRLFKSGRVHSKECKQTRIDIGNKLEEILIDWEK